VCLFSLQILSVVCGPGRVHDFALLKQARLHLAALIEKYADAGSQGLGKCYRNSLTPIKRPKHRDLTPEERAYNRALARVRIHIEHVNRRCKIFRIVKETYRGKHKNMNKPWTLVAALVNIRYAE
jgi:IS5 family transposase